MKIIKADDFIENPPITMSEWIARNVQQRMANLPFASFFQKDTILVPVPRSSLMQPNSLWVPNRIATALVKRGLGKAVVAHLPPYSILGRIMDLIVIKRNIRKMVQHSTQNLKRILEQF